VRARPTDSGAADHARLLYDRAIYLFDLVRRAATLMAGSVLSDAITRITRLEGRTEQFEQTRLRRGN
jgi:hypothetical protein